MMSVFFRIEFALFARIYRITGEFPACYMYVNKNNAIANGHGCMATPSCLSYSLPQTLTKPWLNVGQSS